MSMIGNKASTVVALPDGSVTSAKLAMTPSTSGNVLTSNGSAWVSSAPEGGGYTGFRNKIIGGDFTTNPWQRGTSFTAPTNGTYTADRWVIGYVMDGACNVLKTADAPTAAQAGVYSTHCLDVDVTTADAAIAAAQLYVVQQKVEGFNAAAFGFGQSGTRNITLSFWHKHTVTGTYCVAIRNSATDRSYVAEYTQDVTNTWELATITFAVDTSGTWLYDSGTGISITWAVACGTDRQSTAGSWQAGNFLATANQVNALDSTANNFKIALVQLEAGSVATPFETRPYGTELALCQRYYYRMPGVASGRHAMAMSGVTNTSGRSVISFPTTMRTAPSALEQSGTAGDYSIFFGAAAIACTSVPIHSVGTTGTAEVSWSATSGHTAGQCGTFYSSGTAGYLGWSAEL